MLGKMLTPDYYGETFLKNQIKIAKIEIRISNHILER